MNNDEKSTCPLGETCDHLKLDPSRDGEKKAVAMQHADTPMTTDGFLAMTEDRMVDINSELRQAFKTISEFPKSVTFYGSARLNEGHEFYEKARRLGAACCAAGYGVVTGGGPGIMEGGNRGTNEACGSGIGFNIVLPFEQSANKYVTHGVDFNYFFTRKFAMNFTGEAYLCFPGGFGTLDEFFEILTLVQTKKVQKVPIILVGSEFWQPIMDYSKNILLDKFGTISAEDLDLFKVMDDEDAIMEVITSSSLRGEYYN